MKTIKVLAQRYRQNGHVLYSFAIDARRVQELAVVTPLERDGDTLIGFQRPEIDSHIRSIQSYVENLELKPMLPNSLILGFYKSLKFDVIEASDESEVGWLTIPTPREKIGLVVDGQQRKKALESAAVESFVMNVVAFVAEDESEMKEHFVRVNSSRPLARNLLLELLPDVGRSITADLDRKRLPATLMARMNADEDSPLKGRIKTTTNPDGFVRDSTFVRMLDEAISGDGTLFYLRDDEDAVEAMLAVLKSFWWAVSDTFRDAWDVKGSRLTHAAGILGLGILMSRVADDEPRSMNANTFRKALQAVAPACHWTEGEWNFGADGGRRPWDGVDNTTRGAKLIANLLTREYKKQLNKAKEVA